MRGSSVPTVRRNSPDTPTPASSASVATGSGSGRWSAPPGTMVIRAASTPEAATSAATSREGTTMCAPRSRARSSADSCQRRPRRVVASGWRRQATSWTVTTRRLRLERRRPGAANEIECTMSKPSGACHTPWSQARVRSGPGSREARTGRPKAESGSSGRAMAARSPAGQEGEGDRVAITGGHPAEKATRIRTDAAGHLPAELLDGQEHRGRRALRHRRRPRRRGRAPRGPLRNDPTRTERTRRRPPRAAWRAASRPRRTRPVPPRARRGRPHPS